MRRGLRGRIETGKSGGGNSHGYDVVRRFAENGEPVRGDRTINAAEAAIIRRIFSAYAAGLSPRQIALSLNKEAVPAPRGGAWSASTINGNRARGTGILNNEAYVGRLVWNRLRYAKDPESGQRRSRANATNSVTVVAAPELRIVDDAMWDVVKARQGALDDCRTDGPSPAPAPFWSKQRPRYLFSGLMRCGVCGGGFSMRNRTHFGCSSARNKGATICTNLMTIRRDVLENTVLQGLRHRLMDPILFEEFATAFTIEWNRQQTEAAGAQAAKAADLERVSRQIERLVDALADGTPAAAVTTRLTMLEQRRTAQQADLAAAATPAPRLHPNLAAAYRAKIAALTDALASDDAAATREVIRNLVEAIILVPEGDHLRVEVCGELASILSLSLGAQGGGTNYGSAVLAEQIKMVAGRGFEPLTFRL